MTARIDNATLDQVSLVIIVLGLVATAAWLMLVAADWFRHHDKADKHEALRAGTTLIVWLGFAATLYGRLVPGQVSTTQWVALGARVTLLAMVLWLLTGRQHRVKSEGRVLAALRDEVAGLRREVKALHDTIEARDERIATLTAEAVVMRLALRGKGDDGK